MMIEAELFSQVIDNHENRLLIIPTKKQPKTVEPSLPKPLTKRAKRKLEQLEKKASLKKLRKKTHADLKKTLLTEDQSEALYLISLLQGPKQLPNMKFISVYQKLKDMGIALPDNVETRAAQMMARKAENMAEEVESEESVIDENPELTAEQIAAAGVAAGAAAGVAAGAAAGVAAGAGAAAGAVDGAVEVPFERPTALEEKLKVQVKDTRPEIKRPWDHLLVRETVVRDEKVERARLGLPACQMEQEIVDACLYYPVVIITGGTGCGKSTQVPQFLYEAGLAMKGSEGRLKIGVTQPRRVATVAVANRLSEELGSGHSVEYQVRHERSSTDTESLLKVMTDGILLKLIQADFLLKEYSVIIVDEVHERSVNCDILLGLLSKSAQMRQRNWDTHQSDLPPLRIVLMSATLRLCDFVENPNLFPFPPRRIHIDAKIHPVTVHFAKKTNKNYLEQAKRKVLQIHRRLPPGSILVFLTGRVEIEDLARIIQKPHLKSRKINFVNSDSEEAEDDDHQGNDDSSPMVSSANESSDSEDEEEETAAEAATDPATATVDPATATVDPATATVDPMFSLPGLEDKVGHVLEGGEKYDKEPYVPPKHAAVHWLGTGEGEGKLRVVKLYANLPEEQQKKAFEPPKPNERVVIIATNIAETSITLPNIRYIVDCGFEKQRVYSTSGATSTFQVKQISKANADQRAGRAGRVGPGHCYRLYSSAIFEHEFREYPPVQLLNAPLDQTLHFLASLGVPNLHHFPFPTPPASDAVEGALNRLETLSVIVKNENTYSLTRMGSLASKFPLLPRFGTVIIRAFQAARRGQDMTLLPYVVIAVAAMSVGQDLFFQRDHECRWAWEPVDDLDNYLGAVLKVAKTGDRVSICQECSIVYNRYVELTALAAQVLQILERDFLKPEELANLLRFMSPKGGPVVTFNRRAQKDRSDLFQHLPVPSSLQKQALRFVISCGLVDRLAVRLERLAPLSVSNSNALPYKEMKRYRRAFRSSELAPSQLCFIPPGSVLSRRRPWPDVVVYGGLLGDRMTDLVGVDDVQKLQKVCGNRNALLNAWLAIM